MRDSGADPTVQNQHCDLSDAMVSVVIPAFNSASTIEFQLDALVRQESPGKFEVVVVDNRSTDGTRSVVEAFAAHAPFSCIVVSAQERNGPGYARNCGAAAATGEILMFCDSDDLVRPGWISLLRRDTSLTGVAAGRMAKFTEPDLGERTFSDLSSARQEWMGNADLPWPVSACLSVHRDVFDAVGGFDDESISGEDIDFGMRLIRHQVPLVQSEATVEYRMRGTSKAMRRQLRTYAKWDTIMQLRHADLVLRAGSRPPNVRSDLRSILGHVRRFRHVAAEHGVRTWWDWFCIRVIRLRADIEFRNSIVLRQLEGR